MSSFIYIGCQPGTNSVCKRSLAGAHPELRFAYSRPGFMTYKAETPAQDLRCAFARVHGETLGRASGSSAECAEAFWQIADQQWLTNASPAPRQLHIWARTDRLLRANTASANDTEVTELAPHANSPLQQAINALTPGAAERNMQINEVARPDHWILDCVVVEPEEWWAGRRRATSVPARWVGGFPPWAPPENMVSRAYLKMKEALAWSRMPIRAGDIVAEIGSAPGGACQALLELGAQVIGIDPAEMDPIVLVHPRFTHIRRRGVEVRRRDLAEARWLCVDSNISPDECLTMLESLHAHDQVQFNGMLITLKLPDWRLADQLDEFLERIRQCGYKTVKPRHLHFNRQELCIAAVRSAGLVRRPRHKK
ncbi:MAG: hypothetical protein KDB14_00380 [Planctomycetales bacterium]|nr:hypothetical protein [Planctomycetales bacterium]